MRIAPRVRLRREERRELAALAARPGPSDPVARRATMVLAAAQGQSNEKIARRLGVGPGTVGRWRRRFIQQGVPGVLREAPRQGRPPLVLRGQVEAVVQRTLREAPPDGRRWTVRAMARATGLSRSTVHRIWRVRGVDPRRTSPGAPLASGSDFFNRVTDLVGLYLDPPERAIAFATDERLRGAGPTPAPRRSLEELQRRRRGAEFRAFLQAVERETPRSLDVHLLVDGRLAPAPPPVEHWLARHPRVHLHFLPPDLLGRTAIDRFFAEFSRKRVRPGSVPSVWRLHRALRAHLAQEGADAAPFVWTAPADEIRGRTGQPVIQ
ncbi:MAG TPA: helix-turn-helix domain-containing protein [Thermoplasmata archaeon]|nr:helix-turn-helix domain-containing protein [Thermoplasmata archaeon]